MATIVYFSLARKTKAFAERFKTDGYNIKSVIDAAEMQEPYVLFTPTYNFGQIPEKVQTFLEQNDVHLQAVVATGDRSWGTHFAQAGDKIAAKYGVPLLHKVELRGTNNDYEKVKEILTNGRFEKEPHRIK